MGHLEAVWSRVVFGAGLSGLLIASLIAVIERKGAVRDIVALVKERSDASA